MVDGGYLDRIKLVKKHHYDWIIVMGGTNDLGWGKKPDVIYEGLSEWSLVSSGQASKLDICRLLLPRSLISLL